MEEVKTAEVISWTEREFHWELSSLFLVTQHRNSVEQCACTLYREISAGR